MLANQVCRNTPAPDGPRMAHMQAAASDLEGSSILVMPEMPDKTWRFWPFACSQNYDDDSRSGHVGKLESKASDDDLTGSRSQPTASLDLPSL